MIARKRAATYGAAFVLLTSGLVGTVHSLANTSTPIAATTLQAAPPKLLETNPNRLPRSVPVHLEIPAINVSTNLIQLGKNRDGTMQTPDSYDDAGWYKYSPTPGETGPSIITGHVDNYLGPAVFFRLKELQPGQIVTVMREDGRRATFSVDKVAAFDQATFPTDDVYGDITYAGLRMITCGGTYDIVSGRYDQNIVVYASLLSTS